MFRTFLTIALIVLLSGELSQAATEPNGLWLGTLNAGISTLRLGIESTTSPTGELSITVISIDQGGVRIPSKNPQLVGGELIAPLPQISGEFRGKFDASGDAIAGTWKQGGLSLPLRLERVDRLPSQNRPQEPKPPFPYESQEVAFTHPTGNHTLAGTLTLPKTSGPHAALVLVTGSGPQDRDETLMGHKPFAVIADALTRRGIAVLRYDDRGIGQSTGDFASATSADLATDALAAVRFLAQHEAIDSQRIGLGGHSEGAMIAPMVAADVPEEIAFLVLLAPPAITGEETIVTQGLALEQKMGMSKDEAAAQAKLRRQAIRAAINCTTEEAFKAALETAVEDRIASLPAGKARDQARIAYLNALPGYRGPWFRYFLAYDPTESLQQITCPVLAILGENDVQVLHAENLPPLRKSLDTAPTDKIRIESFPKLNHLLQTSATGLPNEYGLIEETIAPAALELIVEWVAEQSEAND